mmetsp:Transcript_12484/g.31454  ORF Transcript_12484/g.31454 Transcript_12484/m.31454 type:complete len:372 (-) Transcript_12484:736-1851(-)
MQLLVQPPCLLLGGDLCLQLLDGGSQRLYGLLRRRQVALHRPLRLGHPLQLLDPRQVPLPRRVPLPLGLLKGSLGLGVRGGLVQVQRAHGHKVAVHGAQAALALREVLHVLLEARHLVVHAAHVVIRQLLQLAFHHLHAELLRLLRLLQLLRALLRLGQVARRLAHLILLGVQLALPAGRPILELPDLCRQSIVHGLQRRRLVHRRAGAEAQVVLQFLHHRAVPPRLLPQLHRLQLQDVVLRLHLLHSGLRLQQCRLQQLSAYFRPSTAVEGVQHAVLQLLLPGALAAILPRRPGWVCALAICPSLQHHQLALLHVNEPAMQLLEALHRLQPRLSVLPHGIRGLLSHQMLEGGRLARQPGVQRGDLLLLQA